MGNTDNDSVTPETFQDAMPGKNQNYTVSNPAPDEDSDVEVRCGYGKCRPALLGSCNNSKVMLAIMCFYVFAQGFVVNGVFNINVSTLERRFLLKSADMGLVAASYDFSAAAFGVIISYFGSGRHKARWLAFSCVFMIAGSVMYILPHFTAGRYEWGEGVSKVCDSSGPNNTTSDSCEPSGLQNYIGLFAASMVVYGIGGATIYTVGTAYIDDSVSALYSPTYMGIFFGFAALGPGLGYIIGGFFLNVFVDFNRVNTKTLAIDTDDVRWVGAWWLGPLFCIAFFALSGLVLSCFGAELPAAKSIRETRISQLHNGTTSKLDVTVPTRPGVKEIPRVLLALLKNPPFLFTTLAGITEAMAVSGLSTFVAKLTENAFNQSTGNAAILSGIPSVLGLAGGISFGGFFCRCLKLKVKGMLKFCFSVCLISSFCTAFIFATCDQKLIKGVNTAYSNSANDISLSSNCNTGCACTTEFYVSSCDQNGAQYFSPCHAGCVSSSGENKFENCSCISTQPGNVSMVTTGSCETSCSLLYVFLVLLFLLIFFTLAADVPAEQAVLRSIDENHRTIMCGSNRFFIRLIGTVPGSVIYGAATDAGCLTWKNDCGENTSCWIYDISVVSRNYFIITIVTKILSLIFFFCAFWFYKPPKQIDNEIDIGNEKTDAGNKNGETFVNASFNNVEQMTVNSQSL